MSKTVQKKTKKSALGKGLASLIQANQTAMGMEKETEVKKEDTGYPSGGNIMPA